MVRVSKPFIAFALATACGLASTSCGGTLGPLGPSGGDPIIVTALALPARVPVGTGGVGSVTVSQMASVDVAIASTNSALILPTSVRTANGTASIDYRTRAVQTTTNVKVTASVAGAGHFEVDVVVFPPVR